MHLCLRCLLLMQVFFLLGFQTFKVQGLSGWQARTSKSKRHMKNCCLTTPHTTAVTADSTPCTALTPTRRDCIYYYLVARRLKVAACIYSNKQI